MINPLSNKMTNVRGLRKVKQYDDFLEGQKAWRPAEPNAPLTEASNSMYAPQQMSFEEIIEAEEKAKLHEAYERMMVQGLGRAVKAQAKESPLDGHFSAKEQHFHDAVRAHVAKQNADKDRAAAVGRRMAAEWNDAMPHSAAERVLDWFEDLGTGWATQTGELTGKMAGAGPGMVGGGIAGAAATDGSVEGSAAGAAVGGIAAANLGGKVGKKTSGWASKTTASVARNLMGLPARREVKPLPADSRWHRTHDVEQL